MKLEYFYFLSNRNNLLKVAETLIDQLNKERNEIKELNRELKETQEALNNAQISFQEVENHIRITNHSQKYEGKVRQEFFKKVIFELDSIQKTYDLDSCPKRPSTKVLDHIQLINNPMFGVDVDQISDNPLFEINEDTPLDCHKEDDSDFRIWKHVMIPINEYGSQYENGESNMVVHHWISPSKILDFTPYRSGLDFIHQPLDSFWCSIKGNYVLIKGNSLLASFLFIVLVYSKILQIEDDSLVFVVPRALHSIFE